MKPNERSGPDITIRLDIDAGVELKEHALSDVEPGDDARGLRNEPTLRGLVAVDGRVGRDVAGTHVLVECRPYESLGCRIDRHGFRPRLSFP